MSLKVREHITFLDCKFKATEKCIHFRMTPMIFTDEKVVPIEYFNLNNVSNCSYSLYFLKKLRINNYNILTKINVF